MTSSPHPLAPRPLPGRPGVVTAAAVLLIVEAVVALGLGLFVVLVGMVFGSLAAGLSTKAGLSGGTVQLFGQLVGLVIAFVAVGVIWVVAAWGAFRGRAWTRVLFTGAVAAVTLFVGWQVLVTHNARALIAETLVLVPLILLWVPASSAWYAHKTAWRHTASGG